MSALPNDHRLRFGIFMAPFHPAGENPTLALQRDLELIEHLDALGWDEAWIGEHHSAGTEIIASPEIFIAAAAERTKHIKLGTGVISVAYHNPYMVAERAVLLDHLTKGRFMLGVGPGSLPTDAIMLGLDPTETRPLLEEGLDVIIKPAHDRGAREQHHQDVEPDRRPAPPAAVLEPVVRHRRARRRLARRSTSRRPLRRRAAVDRRHPSRRVRPAGPALGRDGRAGGEVRHRRRSGAVATRRDDAHRRESREQAYRDVEFGMAAWFDYFQHTAAFPQMDVGSSTAVREMVDFVNESGLGSIGTADDACEQIERLQKQSGGFGCYMTLAHEWANPLATKRSYELISQRVFPQFQGQALSTLDSKARAREQRERLAERNMQAVNDMVAKHEAELAADATAP